MRYEQVMPWWKIYMLTSVALAVGGIVGNFFYHTPICLVGIGAFMAAVGIWAWFFISGLTD